MRPGNWRELGEGEDVEFTVTCKMNKAWAYEFMAFLATMESLGELGMTRKVSFIADGDGDFRPHFSSNFEVKPRYPVQLEKDIIFDAG